MHSHAVRYTIVWLGLLVLTGVTYGVAQIELGLFSLPVALLVAAVKTTLVVIVFMHLAEHGGSSPLVFGTSMGFVVLLIALSIADLATRDPLATP